MYIYNYTYIYIKTNIKKYLKAILEVFNSTIIVIIARIHFEILLPK